MRGGHSELRGFEITHNFDPSRFIWEDAQAFDHSAQGQLLYSKQRFLEPEHPDAAALQELSAELLRLGVREHDGLGLSKPLLLSLVERLYRTDLVFRCFPAPS